jgi:hypothetical protein
VVTTAFVKVTILCFMQVHSNITKVPLPSSVPLLLLALLYLGSFVSYSSTNMISEKTIKLQFLHVSSQSDAGVRKFSALITDRLLISFSYVIADSSVALKRVLW